jgi:hypothetical protein
MYLLCTVSHCHYVEGLSHLHDVVSALLQRYITVAAEATDYHRKLVVSTAERNEAALSQVHTYIRMWHNILLIFRIALKQIGAPVYIELSCLKCVCMFALNHIIIGTKLYLAVLSFCMLYSQN